MTLDEERRRSVGTAGDHTGEVALDTFDHRGAVEICDEPLDIEPKLGSVANQMLALQRMLTGEHEVQPLPDSWRTTWPHPTLPAGSSCECWRTKNLRHGDCTCIGLSVVQFREGFELYLMKCWSPLDRCQLCADTSQDGVGNTPWKAGPRAVSGRARPED